MQKKIEHRIRITFLYNIYSKKRTSNSKTRICTTFTI